MRRKRAKLLLLIKHILHTNLSVKVSVFAEDIMKVNNNGFSWCLSQELRFGNEDGVTKLNELLGVDLFDFIKSLSSNTFPRASSQRKTLSLN